MSYRLADRGVIRLADGLAILPGDAAWPAYKAWFAAGNRPDPVPLADRWLDLATARAEVRAAINAERDRREAGGFAYAGRVIDSDPRSAQRISLAVQAAQAALAVGAPFAVDWTCADNSTLTLDAAGVIGMPVALAQHAQALHAAAKALKLWAAGAEHAALAAFDATGAGWPA